MFLCNLVIFACCFFVGSANFVFPCLTPNNERTFCISLFACPTLIKSMGTLQPSAIAFVKQSLCWDSIPGDILVCCGSMGNYLGFNLHTESPVYHNVTKVDKTTIKPMLQTSKPTAPSSTVGTPKVTELVDIVTTKPSVETTEMQTTTENISDLAKQKHREFVKRELLPSTKYCGFQHTDDRFYNENATALDEFPWLVHITIIRDYDDDPYQFLTRCNGVLISNRYVLTSENCGLDPEAVRLGQHLTSQEVSCIENPDFPECTEPYIELEIEEAIYRSNTSSVHDLVLLRLNESVSYSDFVRPICLPFDEPKPQPDYFTFSGWGATANVVTVKKRLNYKPVNPDECLKLDTVKNFFNDTEDNNFRDAPKDLTPICYLPKDKDGELACEGDDGTPITYYLHRHQWFLNAILTRVYYKEVIVDVRCSNTLPVVGIKITQDILNWIMDNMRP